jgi:hypothetical protein
MTLLITEVALSSTAILLGNDVTDRNAPAEEKFRSTRQVVAYSLVSRNQNLKLFNA